MYCVVIDSDHLILHNQLNSAFKFKTFVSNGTALVNLSYPILSTGHSPQVFFVSTEIVNMDMAN